MSSILDQTENNNHTLSISRQAMLIHQANIHFSVIIIIMNLMYKSENGLHQVTELAYCLSFDEHSVLNLRELLLTLTINQIFHMKC